jgi:PAS domain S-box-containing protein
VQVLPYQEAPLKPHNIPDPIPIKRENAEKATPTNDLIFRLLVETVKDYAIFVLDPEGYVLTWNEGAKAIKGYSRDEILGKHFSIFYPPESAQSNWPARELALAEREGRFIDEGWRVKKNGDVFWASVTITALRESDGRLYGFAKVTQDLSSRREAEERIQNLNKELRNRIAELGESQRIIELRTMELQRLSAELLRIQDEERRRLARELHDDLSQHLSALKMELDAAKNERLGNTVGQILSSVRNLSYLLHPPLLDETGLKAALHWYVEGVSQRSKIQISLNIMPQAFPRLSKDIERTIFRVVQESLSNVYRHSGSESARVEVEKQPDFVAIRIRDYGKGVPSQILGKGLSPGLGVGIPGMRERVRQFGGDLIVSRAEPGTLIDARIPLFALPAS